MHALNIFSLELEKKYISKNRPWQSLSLTLPPESCFCQQSTTLYTQGVGERDDW